MKKIFLFIVIGIFLISFASAFLGTYQAGNTINIRAEVSNATSVSFNLYYPNTTLIVENGAMSQLKGDIWNYTFFSDASITGDYVYDYCDQNGNNCKENYFKLTPSGRENSTGESILYLIFTFIFFGLLLLNFYFIMILPGGNIKNDRGEIMGILKLKYVRIFLIAISYPLILILLNFMNGLAINFTSLTIFAGILGFLFETMLSGAWIFTLLIIVWIFYNLIRDSNLKKKLKKYGNMRI